MTHGVRLYLVGSFVLVSLVGCGRGFFSAEREPWRAEAEIACLKSGAVKEGPDLVRIEPISGPGMCGADYPLKVAALGESVSSVGFADESLRPPAVIGNQPRWPVNPPPPSAYRPAPTSQQPSAPAYGSSPAGPISLNPPGVPAEEDDIELPPEGSPGASPSQSRAPYGGQGDPPRERHAAPAPQQPYEAPASQPVPRLGPSVGPAQGSPVGAVGPVAIKPTATLACPIVSVLDRWLAESVQPAAQRWFGTRVIEIKQISAYSCRGMNGNASAHISEHAFGNALDIAAFTLADGRRITVKDGWRGMPEEQGFLRDVEAAACQQFKTVLAPGSNVYHYDHIHIDLMRRASGRIICQPAAVSGDEVAARAAQRNPYAAHEPGVTGSLGPRKAVAQRRKANEKINEEDEFSDE